MNIRIYKDSTGICVLTMEDKNMGYCQAVFQQNELNAVISALQSVRDNSIDVKLQGCGLLVNAFAEEQGK